MKTVIYFLMDLACYGLLGRLLAELPAGILSYRFFPGRAVNGHLMALQFLAVRMVLSYDGGVQQLLFGKDGIMEQSGVTSIPLAISLCVTLVFSLVMYQGSRMACVSLVVNFYALLELVRFTWYSFFVWTVNRVFGFYTQMFLQEMQISQSQYMQLADITEIIGNFAVTGLTLALFFWCMRTYKKYLLRGDEILQQSESSLLLVTGSIGLLLSIILRSIMISYRDHEVYLILDEHPQMYLLIPGMAWMCILAVLLSARLLAQTAKEHEKRQNAELYRSRVKELEAHILDMQEMESGIRGMKHDMKNHIANIQALLAQMYPENEENELNKSRETKEIKEIKEINGMCVQKRYQKELVHYLDSMEAAMEHFELKYQTGNPVTDVMIARYVKQAEKKGIRFVSEFFYPAHMHIDAFDLSILLNNALENALEACSTTEDHVGKIRVASCQKENMFFLTVENTYDGSLKRFRDGMPETKKKQSGHGFGLKNIKSCAEKYYGKAEIKTDAEWFTLTVMLQNPKEKNGKNGTFSGIE